MIYLDNNATTPVLPEVAEAMQPFWTETFGNASSRHGVGRRARRALEDARELVAALLGAAPDEVVFTSGGTEANHLAIRGLAEASEAGGPRWAITSAIEHPSVSGLFDGMQREGWRVDRLGADGEGVVDAAEFAGLLRGSVGDRPCVVSVMLANNETGAVQPVAELAAIAGEHGLEFHTDAVQGVGKMPVHFRSLGVSTLSLGAHKFHGPKGVGALLVRKGTGLRPVLRGGHPQEGLRAGTEPVALVVGMAKALEMACRDLAERTALLRRLRDRLHKGLGRALGEVILNGPREGRLANTLNVSFPGVEGQALLMALDLEGVACSVGSACASGSTQPSPVLQAMGLSDAVLRSAVRFSVGAMNRESDIDEAVRRIAEVVRRLSLQAPAAAIAAVRS